MRTCPACHTAYSGDEETCPADGARLRADEIEPSDALATATTAVVVGVSAAPTPSPLVRSNPTPGPRVSGASADSDSLVGSMLAGRYEVTRKIGEGGMGVVYEGRHTLIGKRVAIKVLLDKYAQKADIVARLQQEARLASSIGHEHIVDITDFGETDDGRTFVVMEFLEGESLAHLLQREGPLPPARAIAIVRQVAGALGAAHHKGIVHRDVKPENIFIIRRGDRDFAKVVDFGISKAMRPLDDDGGSSSPRLTHTGMVLGTPLYMSPEQARGEDQLDHRIDVYALGVILYECLTGETPFRGTNYLNVISAVISQEPRRPSEARPDLGISEALESVVLKAMAKDRDVRYQAMAELDADLAKVQEGAGAAALSASTAPPGRARGAGSRRTLLWIAVVVGVAGATAAAVIPLVAGTGEEPRAAPPPEPSVVAAPAPQPSPEPAPPPAPPPEMVNIAVESTPDRAKIFVDGKLVDYTPKVIPFAKSDKPVQLVLRLDGYADLVTQIVPQRDDSIHLEFPKKPGAGATKKPPGMKKPPAPTPSPSPSPRTSPTGRETKPDPYGQ